MRLRFCTKLLSVHQSCKVVISNYLVLALIAKFDLNFFNNFPCMYVGLIVRGKCERSVKNQGSKDEQVDFATGSREATCEKAIGKAHDWKMKSRARL